MIVDIVFDGPPGPQSGRFVEAEDKDGVSIKVGEWINRGNGYHALRLNTIDDLGRRVQVEGELMRAAQGVQVGKKQSHVVVEVAWLTRLALVLGIPDDARQTVPGLCCPRCQEDLSHKAGQG